MAGPIIPLMPGIYIDEKYYDDIWKSGKTLQIRISAKELSSVLLDEQNKEAN